MENEAAARIARKEAEERRFQADMALRSEEIKHLKDMDEARKTKELSLAARMLNFFEAVKNVFVKMNNDPAEAPVFFDRLENLFKMYKIPEDIKSKLLIPLLSPKARQVTNRLSLTELDVYATVKDKILSEFKLTSREYLQRFRNAKKTDGTYTMFSSRLANLLSHYFCWRDAEKNVVNMFDVIVSDKLNYQFINWRVELSIVIRRRLNFPSFKISFKCRCI